MTRPCDPGLRALPIALATLGFKWELAARVRTNGTVQDPASAPQIKAIRPYATVLASIRHRGLSRREQSVAQKRWQLDTILDYMGHWAAVQPEKCFGMFLDRHGKPRWQPR